MKLLCFSVLDSSARTYGQLFCTPTVGSAVRGFSDQVNSGERNALTQHPEDFELHLIGSFDDVSGEFDIGEDGPLVGKRPQLVARAKDLKVK